MAIKAAHEIHQRRWSRNAGVALVLAAFIAVIFGLTIAKVSGGGSLEAFDHAPRNSIPVNE